MMMRGRRVVWTMGVCAAGFVSAAADAGISRHDRDLEYHRQLAMQPQFQAAGAMRFGGARGSGTLIAPGWVLTAAHGTELANVSGIRFTIGGTTYASVEKHEHPDWKGSARITEGYDLALVRLSEEVQGIDPAALYRGTSIVGRTATLVGAGLTGDGLTGQIPGTLGTMHAGQNTIDATADQLASFLPGLALSSNGLVIDFDSPLGPGLNRIGSATPLDREFFTGQGDSGGAYWVDDGAGGWSIASVQSWGTTNNGGNFGMYGNMAVSAKIYEPEVLAWIDGITGLPAPGGAGVFVVVGVMTHRRRR